MGKPGHRLPYALAHQRRGAPKVGHARHAGGLILRAMVLDVFRPSDPAGDRGKNLDAKAVGGNAAPGVTCDLLIIDAGYRTKLYNVPIMVESAGLNDYIEWEPRPTTVDLTTAAPAVAFHRSALDLTPITPTHKMDGDLVVVAFLANDLNQPVIIGQLPHPSTNRKPSYTDLTKYKWRRYIRGVDIGITEAGNVDINLQAASSGSIAPPLGSEIPTAPAAGNITITQAPLGKVQILDSVLSAPQPVLLGSDFLADLTLALDDITLIFDFAGILLPNVEALQAKIILSQAAGIPYMSTHLEVD